MKHIILMVSLLLIGLNLDLSAQIKTDESQSITVYGNCEMCKRRIESAALNSGQVATAKWDLHSYQLTFTPKNRRFNSIKLHEAIASAGHDTNERKADITVYNELHTCCKYRETLAAILSPTTEEDEHAGHDHAAEAQKEDTIDEHAGHNHETHVANQDDHKDHNHEAIKEHDHDHNGHEVCATVYEEKANGKLVPLFGANAYWLGTTKGVVSDDNGNFELPMTDETNKLVVSFVGFGTDTLYINKPVHYNIILKNGSVLGTVDVVFHVRSTQLSKLSPIKTQYIGEGELLKAACCNLSESFATNPTVDVSFTDAVTGTRQIEMLGLAGPYVQITRENMPDIRGLASVYGFTYTPGPWVEGIQLNMGNGSVVNGYESMTGQINVELKKPEKSEKLFVNLYGSADGMIESNLNSAITLNENWSTGFLVHGKYLDKKNDRNNDGFLDHPLIKQFSGINRWKFFGKNGLEGQFGFKGTLVDQISGQTTYNEATDKGTQNVWGAGMATTRLEAWAKFGKVFPSRPYSSVGLQLAGTYHDQNNYFGLSTYDSEQNSMYANLIYQSQFGSPVHTYKTGTSFAYDNIDETVVANSNWLFDREEIVPGAFFEYTYMPNDDFSFVTGMRADHHNNYGTFYTPRMHLRYVPFHETIVRLTAGSGTRTANIFAEHMGVFASSRNIYIENDVASDKPYGLDQERSWNVGINLSKNIHLGAREATLSLDYYRTNFDKQIITDLDVDARSVYFYNLDGKSFANSFQAQVDYELLPRLDMRLAYRFNEVKRDYKTGLLDKPLASQHRAFLNLAYATINDWRFDFTLNWQSEKRIPTTADNLVNYQLNTQSPDYFMGLCQVNKTFGKHLEIYAGFENLFDYRQDNPIISVEDPFGDNFDSSLIWGPIFGRKSYIGLRYTL